jgi:TRAP-type mannitol/chloroaromatic compound transport system permease small subunit
MKPAHSYSYDSHPKLFINTQIFWIIFGTGLVYKWLPRTIDNWQAGETYNLPQGIAYFVIGLVVVIVAFIMVNATVSRLQSKTPSNPDPSEAERR